MTKIYFRSLLFRFPHGLVDNDQTSLSSSYNLFEILKQNLEKIRIHLDVKTLDEYYNLTQSYSPFLLQQQQYTQSTENLSINPGNDESSFTDLNLRGSKRSLHRLTQTFKIDYVNIIRMFFL